MEPPEAFTRFWEEGWPLSGEDAHGAGSFGKWTSDDQADPAYEYELAHDTDPRAACGTSRGESRDHWHLVGNDRVIATAHNEGYVQLYDWSRGGKVVNRWNPATRDYAGGFKFIHADGESFNTLWQGLPEGTTQRRIFGTGYFEKVTRCGDLTVTERVEAPQGDDPALLSITTIENTGNKPCDLSCVEFWGVALHQLIAAPLMTNPFGWWFKKRREWFSSRFTHSASWDSTTGTLIIDTSFANPHRAPAPDARSIKDYHPKSTFLAALDPLPEGFAAYATDGGRFFGKEGLTNPPGIQGAADGCLLKAQRADNASAVLAMRRVANLTPGETKTWRYLYGYADKKAIPELVQRHRAPYEIRPRPALEFVAPEVPWLQRELAWHSYYLQAGSFYSDYYNAHMVDQGSAYGYVHGFSGATRDFALFILPMVYLRPDLAKDMLRLCLRTQRHKDGKFPYALVGHGCVRGYIAHSWSSDLDLFVLWSLAEYLGATRDLEFLNENLPFYPLSAGKTTPVLDHARAAFRHLVDKVGLGAHGLLRCGTGDWNDVLFGYSRFSPLTLLRGESTLNAGMATLVLPRMADILDGVDAALATEMRAFAQGQAQALESLWTGDWLARGYLGYGDATLGADRLFLDTQAFPVLGGVWDSARTAKLFKAIQTQCVDPQPAGALALWPPMKGPLLEPGSDTNGGTWAAVDSWTAWAWATHDPQAAWDFYLKTTLAARAEAFPDVWYGVWSGPDSYNAHYHPRPAETFDLNATPMTDFPVMNMNRHSGPLLDAIKFSGIEPRDDVLVIDPHLPLESFAIRLPLVGFAYTPDGHRGYYRPVASGTFRFAVRPPSGLDPQRAKLTVNAHEVPFTTDADGLIHFEADGEPGQMLKWELANPTPPLETHGGKVESV